MPKKPLKFTVQIPVKSYVKKFIELDYGSPVNFNNHPDDHRFFHELLSVPSHRFDERIPDCMPGYSETLEVWISEDDFYRYGWQLSKTNVVLFGKRFEKRAKFFMRTTVGVYSGLGLPIFKSIQKFQKTFDFSEEDWRYDSLKKEFYRHDKKMIVDFDNEIFRKIEYLILDHLSELGTIAQGIKKHHERNFEIIE